MIGIWKEKIQELEMKNRSLHKRKQMLENEIIDIKEEIIDNNFVIYNYEELIEKGEPMWTDLNTIYSLVTMILKYNGVVQTQSFYFYSSLYYLVQ